MKPIHHRSSLRLSFRSLVSVMTMVIVVGMATMMMTRGGGRALEQRWYGLIAGSNPTLQGTFRTQDLAVDNTAVIGSNAITLTGSNGNAVMTGSVTATGDVKSSAGAVRLATATWTQSTSTPVGACTTGSMVSITSNVSPAFYVCASSAWIAVAGGTVTGAGTANQTAKFSGTGTIANGWAGDTGSTWGSAGVFTINESSGSASANGDFQTQGALKLATATWTQGASAPVGACVTGSMYSVTTNTSPAFYVCASSAWVALAGGGVTGSGTANQTTKWSGTGTIANGWAGDTGSTWGSAGVFTINESSGSASANGDFQTQGALKLATATWTQGASAPVGACVTGSMYSVTTSTSPAFYVCASSAWVAVAGGTVTGAGTANQTAKWSGTGTIANGWAGDTGTTWGSAGVFTINESSGSASANGDFQTQGALKLATATWTQGASAPVGACITGSMYSVTSNVSPAFYVCANTAWVALASGTVTGTGSSNQTTKFSGTSTITNGWAGDTGTTWGSAGVFTINESSGSASANGDFQTQGALKLATATWTQGASAPVGACVTGSMYSVTTSTSPAFYVCASSAWLAVAGGTVTGTGTTGDLAIWSSSTAIGNYAGSACGSGTFANAIGSNGGLTCGSASGGTGTVTSITCGTGLTCSPGSPITTSGTISVTAVTPSMTLANATQSASVNLSTVGTGQIDWLFQGAPTSSRVFDNFTGSIFEKTSGGGVLIQPGIDLLGATGTVTQTNGTVTFTSNAADTIGAVAVNSVQGAGITGVTGTGGGIRFVAPVTTSQRVFRFYTSHSNSTWVCTAHLLDGSFADQTTTSTTASTIEEVGTVTVTAGSNTYLVVYCAVTATTAGTVVLKWYADVLSTG